jgi:hypothetical protein
VWTPGGVYDVQWNTQGKATAMGQLAFFAEFLKPVACLSAGCKAGEGKGVSEVAKQLGLSRATIFRIQKCPNDEFASVKAWS